ncbi:MAG: hypothetical protein WBA12_04995 [Catalinimonas sp.]
MRPIIFLTLPLLVFACLPGRAQILLDVEGGVVVPGYNEIRIPGAGGTLFDATDALDAQPKVYYRLRAGYRINDRHNLFALYAPLAVDYEGAFGQVTQFEEAIFQPGEPVELLYVFNSYRLTYRYDLVRQPNVRFGVGLTAKIRDAKIEVTGTDARDENTNVGFVPLVNLYLDWRFTERLGLLIEGDGLASSQGRAFDFEVALPLALTESLRARIGYRFLEGGANNDEVYNFTFLSYGLAGLSYHF